MSNEHNPDIFCMPYRRKGLYFALTIPFFALLILVFLYLWTFSILLSLGFISFYFMMCWFQAYCCAYQDCPYVGGFCPAVAGIIPGNVLAKVLYRKKKISKSKRAFEIRATLAFGGLFGLILFPLYWIAKLSLFLAIGYVLAHGVYYLLFIFTICPVCAIRTTCPGGKLHQMILGN